MRVYIGEKIEQNNGIIAEVTRIYKNSEINIKDHQTYVDVKCDNGTFFTQVKVSKLRQGKLFSAPKNHSVKCDNQIYNSIEDFCKYIGICNCTYYKWTKEGLSPEEIKKRKEIQLDAQECLWTKKDVEILKNKYPENGSTILELLEKYTEIQIQRKAYTLGLKVKKRKTRKWTKYDISLLEKEFPKNGCQIAELLSKYSETAIKAKAKKLKLYRKNHWTPEEIEILKKEYPKKGAKIPELLKRHASKAISEKARSLDLKTELCCIDHNGTVFDTNDQMCTYYGITTGRYYKRRQQGWNKKSALTTPLEFITNHKLQYKNL